MSPVANPLDLVALVFEGKKSRFFLQGMATNNLDLLVKGEALPSLFCQYQGKLFASGYLIEQTDDEIWLLCSSAQAKLATDHLAQYARLSRVTLRTQPLCAEGIITTDPQPTPVYALQNDVNGYSMMIGQHCQICWSIEQGRSMAASNASLLKWQAALIQAGIPVMSDPIINRFTPNQLGLVPSDWVRLDKGCYCGQEIIARTFHLGKTQRQLIALSCQLDHGVLLEAGITLITSSGSKLLLVCVTKIESEPNAFLQVASSADVLDNGNLLICTPQGQTIACKQVGC